MPGSTLYFGDGRRARGRANRDRILAAARELFAERGYEATSMDAIAARTGVARTTIFNHFPQKQFLFEALGEPLTEELRTALERIDRDRGTRDRLLGAFAEWADHYECEPQLNKNLLRAWISVQDPRVTPEYGTEELLSRVIEEGRLLGDVRLDIEVEAAAVAIFDTALGVLLRWAREPSTEPGDLRRRLLSSIRVVVSGTEQL